MKLKGLRWWIITLVCLATVINYIDRSALGIMWPEVSKDLGLTKEDYSWIINIFTITYAAGKFISGKLYDKVGTKIGFVLSIFFWSLASVLHFFAKGAASLGIFRGLLGVAEAGNWPGAVKNNAEWFPIKERGLAQGIFNAGATGGIGFEVAKRLGKDGYTVVLNGIQPEEGTKRVEELTAEGITAEYYNFDVTKENEVTDNIVTIGKKYGKIDVLVNNAGGLGGRSRFEEMTTDFYRNVMALNLDSVFFASRAAIPFLKNGEHPSIINYTSNAGWTAGGPGDGIYGTS